MSRRMEHLQTVACINSEFKQFWDFCNKEGFSEEELDLILLPLRRQLKFDRVKQILKWSILIIGFIGIILYIPLIWEFLSAIGRICLIKFVLPVWNWSYLYNSDCLVTFSEPVDNQKDDFAEEYFPHESDCAVCEGIDYIDYIENTIYSQLYTRYLQRGVPVVITDFPSVNQNLSVTKQLLQLENILESKPCHMESNLIMSRFANLEDVLLAADKTLSGWFLHFRNCNFDAVKESRHIWQRPYYIGAHIEPFHSSWIVMSEEYDVNVPRRLSVEDLVQFIQLEGELVVQLVAKGVCYSICGDHELILVAGQTLVFMADLWEFMYIPANSDKSVSFVTETHWNP